MTAKEYISTMWRRGWLFLTVVFNIMFAAVHRSFYCKHVMDINKLTYLLTYLLACLGHRCSVRPWDRLRILRAGCRCSWVVRPSSDFPARRTRSQQRWTDCPGHLSWQMQTFHTTGVVTGDSKILRIEGQGGEGVYFPFLPLLSFPYVLSFIL